MDYTKQQILAFATERNLQVEERSDRLVLKLNKKVNVIFKENNNSHYEYDQHFYLSTGLMRYQSGWLHSKFEVEL